MSIDGHAECYEITLTYHYINRRRLETFHIITTNVRPGISRLSSSTGSVVILFEYLTLAVALTCQVLNALPMNEN